MSNKETKEFIEAIVDLKKKIKLCSFCLNVFESENESKLCEICSNPTRNKDFLCIIEKESDLTVIEQTKKYKGFYFVLGGTLSPLRKNSVTKIKLKELSERLKNYEKYGFEKPFKEIIIATNFTSQGDATALYLEGVIKPSGIKTTRLAKGMPTGGEIEYIDEETISSALEGRK